MFKIQTARDVVQSHCRNGDNIDNSTRNINNNAAPTFNIQSYGDDRSSDYSDNGDEDIDLVPRNTEIVC